MEQSVYRGHLRVPIVGLPQKQKAHQVANGGGLNVSGIIFGPPL